MKPGAALLSLILLGMPAFAVAEGSGHAYTSAGETPVAKAKTKAVKARPAKPSLPPPKIPDAPIPYTSLSDTHLTPDIAKALTPQVPASHAHPVTVTETPAAAPPSPAAPLPASQQHMAPLAEPKPVVAAGPPPPPAPPQPTHISLKCDTTTTREGRQVSSGSFFIDLMPSPVFPDQQADFQFRFVDPSHTSLIRDTICLDTRCAAQVTPTAYALINRVSRKGDALRITLDRARGGFYAEAIDDRLTGTSRLAEQGWCTPQVMPSTALF